MFHWRLCVNVYKKSVTPSTRYTHDNAFMYTSHKFINIYVYRKIRRKVVKGNNGKENDGVEQCRFSCELLVPETPKHGLIYGETLFHVFANIQFLFLFVRISG